MSDRNFHGELIAPNRISDKFATVEFQDIDSSQEENHWKSLDSAKIEKEGKIRIIAPSKSLGIIAPELRETTHRRLKVPGFDTISKYAEKKGRFRSSPVNLRLEVLHEAFAAPEVKGILQSGVTAEKPGWWQEKTMRN